MVKQPIGIFDSGYGGLTILKEITALLPDYDYMYMGDNARAPYGPLPFQTVYEYTLQAVEWFFSQGCSLVVLACNTASAKALRSIQQRDLPLLGADKRVLGVIRPTAEVIGDYTSSQHVGILGTQGTVSSGSYLLEIEKFFPGIAVTQEACPTWVDLVENNEYNSDLADGPVKMHLEKILSTDPKIDTLLLACTHYPLLIDKIKLFVPGNVRIISQGKLIAVSLNEYLDRHPEIRSKCSLGGSVTFFTTGEPLSFDSHTSNFYGKAVTSTHIELKEKGLS
jgi:glutamate racemase